MCVCVCPPSTWFHGKFPSAFSSHFCPTVPGGWTDGQQERGGDLRGRRSGVAGTVAWMVILVIQNWGLHRRNDVYRFEDQARFLSIVTILINIHPEFDMESQIDVILKKMLQHHKCSHSTGVPCRDLGVSCVMSTWMNSFYPLYILSIP